MLKIYLTASEKANEHRIGVSLARYALFDTYGFDSPLLYDSRGKPYFDCDGVHISISHSHNRCIAAISDSQIGADIEFNCADADRLIRLSERYFTKEETEYIKTQPCERFYEIWCAKESYIKYTGEGFSRTLSSFSVLDAKLHFSCFNIDDYTVCVCSKEKADTPPIFIENLDLQD